MWNSNIFSCVWCKYCSIFLWQILSLLFVLPSSSYPFLYGCGITLTWTLLPVYYITTHLLLFLNRGRKPGFARKESVEKKIMGKEKQRRSKKELQNFYRFQIRESKMKRTYEKVKYDVCFHSVTAGNNEAWNGVWWQSEECMKLTILQLTHRDTIHPVWTKITFQNYSWDKTVKCNHEVWGVSVRVRVCMQMHACTVTVVYFIMNRTKNV